MTQNNTEGLHSITYLALIILAAVLFFYLRKRHEHNRLDQNRLYTSIQHIPTVKTPSGFSPQPFQEPGTGLPTFSAQEVGQRKMPREIDHTNVNRKNLSTISDFANNISSFDPLSRSKDQLNNTTEKIFGDNKRQQPYEPSRLAASPPITSPKGWKPDQTLESSFRSTIEFPVPSGNDQKGFSHPIVPRREELGPASGNQNKVMENEYRGFRDGRNFRESPRGFNQLDHSGLSLDSPLRMLGSPIQAADSKKKIGSQDDDQDKSNLSILSKIDSFSKTQTALTQKNKTQDRVPHNQRSTQNKLVEKNEKKAKRNQVFIDNGSDDEMIVEDVKDIYSENKRPGKDSKGIDVFEKESSKKKYLKTNEEQAKIASDTKNTSLLEDSHTERLDSSDTSKLSSKKKSVADLSYISERGVNSSMRRYVEKKSMREEANKSNNFIAPSPQPRVMEIEKKPVDPFLMKSQEKPQKASLFTAQNPLSGTPTQNKPAGFLFTNQPKPSIKETEKVLEEEKPATEKPGLLFGLNKPVEKKIEEEKESPKPAQSISLFSQPKPEEKQPEAKSAGFGSLFSQPKPAESASSGSLFKQPASGLFAGKPESAVSQQEEQIEDKPKDTQASSNTSSSLFSGAFANKKPDSEVVKDQEAKTESKPLFAKSDNGLFSNLGSGSAFAPAKTELQITKIPSNTENAPSSLLKTDSGLFGKTTTPPGLFGSAFSKPKEETDGLTLQKSASQVATESPPKTEEEGSKGGIFNKLASQKPDLNSLFGGQKAEEKKETAPSTSLGLFSTPGTLFKTNSTEQANLDFKKGDPFGSSTQPEGKPGGLFGQKTEQPLIGFAPTSSGSLFSQRDTAKKTEEPKKTEDPLGSFAKNPLESPKRGDNPLAGFSQNPTGNLFGMRAESPKKADKPTIEPAKNPTGNIFGQNPESPKKSEGGLFGNLIKPAGEGNKPGLFGSGAFGSNLSSGSGAAANGGSGFSSLFKNDAKPSSGGLFSNLVNNNEAQK